MHLVEYKKKEVWVESNLVARKFGMKHSELTKTIKKVIEKLNKLRGVIAPLI